MVKDTPTPPKPAKPRETGPYEPVEFDYSTGKRIAPRRPRKPGEPIPLAEDWDHHPHDEC
jgi:hypothetical protein